MMRSSAPLISESQYFDSLVEHEGDFNPFTERGWTTLARRFAEVAPAGPLRLLDVGCGTGRSHAIYEARAGLYIGIDLSFRALLLAQRRLGRRICVLADATALPFAPASFEVVAFSSVLHHIGDYGQALSAARSVLKRRGLVFAFDPNLLHPAMALFRHPQSPLYSAVGVSPHERPLLPSALRSGFHSAGLIEIGQRCQSDLPYREVGPRGLNRWLALYNFADRWFERVGLGRWLGTFVVTWGRVPFDPRPAASHQNQGLQLLHLELKGDPLSDPHWREDANVSRGAANLLAESPPRYSVVVPVFNEAEAIGPFCRHALDALPPGYELLICYDMPKDSTLPALAALDPAQVPATVRLIHNTLGRGARWAIEAGMRAARAPIVLVSMVDLSDDYRVAEEMIRRAEAGGDVVCASRYMRGGRQIGGPRLKALLSRTAGVTLHWMTGLPTHDPTNSFKAYRRDFLERTPIESTQGFCLALELTVKAHFGGGRVEEVPATWRHREAGKSRFRVMAWLPSYLRWYGWALRRRWER